MTEKRTIEDEVDALKADMAKLRDDLKEFATMLKDAAGSRAEAGAAFSGFGQTWEDFAKKIEDARKQGDQTLDDLTEHVKQHPLSRVALAFGVGYVISKIMNLGGRR
jgi:ElaB/YqjD/DUF883 family membrane-anchored ribosome-binding protein